MGFFYYRDKVDKMPTIRNGEDLCETTCLCGYNIKVSQSRFKLMMRLHYKKCAYKREMLVTQFTLLDEQVGTGVIKKTTSGVASILK